MSRVVLNHNLRSWGSQSSHFWWENCCDMD